MRSEHECFVQPKDPDIRIWRYMDLAKFVSFVQEQTLFFARADHLGDPFEGSVTLINHQWKHAIRELRKHPEMQETFPDIKFYFEMNDEQFERCMSQMSLFNRQNLQEFYVSCWHMNEFESAAMWSLYGPKNSLCIQTTYKKLAQHLPDFINVGLINYIDYRKEIIPQVNSFYNIMHKRKSFEHEREVRAVHWKSLSKELIDDKLIEFVGSSGVKVKLGNLEPFIERILISPEAPDWFKPLVDNLLERYSLKIVAVASEMGGSPLY